MNRGGTNGNVFLGIERPRKKHACFEVHFERKRPLHLTPITCTCGWFGTLTEWPNHAPGLQVALTRKDAEWGGPALRMPDTRMVL